MRLLLRADASPTIGVGHVARTVAFAEQARSRGWPVVFSGSLDGADFFAARLRELGVPIKPPTGAGDERALPALASAVGAGIVLVDHYDVPEQRRVLNAVGAVLVSLEGGAFGRRAADVVVDPGPPKPRPDDGSGVVLRGPAYAPIREQVVSARVRRAREHVERDGWPPRVVVVLGGGAVWRDTVTRLLTALRDTDVPFDAEVVAHGAPDLPEAGPGQRFTLSTPDSRLPGRLAAADLAVSAAGVTLLEACCIGVPTALVLLVDNQEPGYRAAVAEGYAAGLGRGDTLEDAPAVLTRLLREPSARAALASAASEVVDGDGAARVLDAAVKAHPTA